MVSGQAKRLASRSPSRERANKRLATSSPEEGEVDDATPTASLSNPSSLSAKPPAHKGKVPFPFKKKDSSRNEPGPSRLENSDSSATYSRPDNDDARQRQVDNGRRGNRRGDHWEPGLVRGSGRKEVFSSRHPPPRRDYGREHRERGRTPPSPRSPSRSSTSPSSNHHEKHRLPAPISPDRSKSPSRGRERGWDRNRDRRRDDDDRYYPPRDSGASSDRYYRPGEHKRGREDRDTRGGRRDDRPYDRHEHDRQYRKPDRRDTYRPVSPRAPHSPPSPQPHNEHASPSAKPPLSQEVPPLAEPPADAEVSGTPPPPACSPPPAPPPDPRLTKGTTLPEEHVPVSILLSRPPAPRGIQSPKPLPLPPAKVEAVPSGPGDKELKLRLLRKRDFVRRSTEEEKEAYGRMFVGCGKQSDYSVTTKLGEGTFGEVHKAIQKATNRTVALKRILMHNEKEGMPVTALREIKILKALKHPCIVEILDMFVVRSTAKDPLSVYMVFPYMDHDLAGLLENDRVKLQPSQIKLYMKQLLEGTEYMHRNHILHRDMKAANLLISNSGSLRIADFGLARTFDGIASRTGEQRKDRKYTNCVVTRWYRPPELLLGARHYGGEVDIWGIGCVLGEMFWRRPILPGVSDLDQLDKTWQLCGTPNQHTWPNFDALPGCEGVKRFTSYSRKVKQTYESIGFETCDLLDKLLTCNPRERITAAQALDHDYFWTDPLPADPKTLPSYEASHEFDKRGHRNQHPPQPHPPHPPPNLARHPQEPFPKNPQQTRFYRLGVPPPLGTHGALPYPKGRGGAPHGHPRGNYHHQGQSGPGIARPQYPHLPPRPQAPQGVPPPRGMNPPERPHVPRHAPDSGGTQLNYG